MSDMLKRGRTPLETSAAYMRQRAAATLNGRLGYRRLPQQPASLTGNGLRTSPVGNRAQRIRCVIIGASRAIRPVRMIAAITSQQLINDAGVAKLVNTSLSSGTVLPTL